MDFKTFLKAVAYRFSFRRSVRKKLAKTYVSLFLIFVIAASSTFAWFYAHVSVEVSSPDYKFQSAASLRVNNNKSSGNKLHIEGCFLDEASSVDGRNIYLPLSGNFSSNTADMIFREANAGDRVIDEDTAQVYVDNPDLKGHFIYKSFELKGSSNETDVFIKSYKIEVSNGKTAENPEVNGVYQDELDITYNSNNVPTDQHVPPEYCPIRLAFIDDSANTPVVIDPSANVEGYVENCNAVRNIDDYGKPTTQQTNVHSFATYYYNKTPLFTIPGNTEREVTLVVWLEGTMNSGNTDKYIGKKISIDIDIESNFADMDTIQFIDATPQHWVSDDNTTVICSYMDPFSEEGRYKTVEMTKSQNYASDYTWNCQIPKRAISDISFYRLTPPNSSEGEGWVWNSWHTYEGVDGTIQTDDARNHKVDGKALQDNRQYEDDYGNKHNYLIYKAFYGNGYNKTTVTSKRLAPCIGYWISDVPHQDSTESGGTISTDYYIGYNPNNSNYIDDSNFRGMYAMYSLGNGTYYYPLQYANANFWLIINNANQKGSILTASTVVNDDATNWAGIRNSGSVQWCTSYRSGNGTVYIIFDPSGDGTITITNTNPA